VRWTWVGFWQLRFTGTPSRWRRGNASPIAGAPTCGCTAPAHTDLGIARNGNAGNAVKIWRLGASGSPTLVNSLIVPGIGTVSDVEVSSDGKLLVFSAEGSTSPGVYVYSLADPEMPVLIGFYGVGTGVHTASIADIAGKRYVFAAKNPSDPALLILDIAF
jgi:hypothetical protein